MALQQDKDKYKSKRFKSDISRDVVLLKSIIATICDRELMLNTTYRTKLTALFRKIDTDYCPTETIQYNILARSLLFFINEYPETLGEDFNPSFLLKSVKNTDNAEVIDYFLQRIDVKDSTSTTEGMLDRINAAMNKDLYYNSIIDDLNEIDDIRDLLSDDIGSQSHQVILDEIAKKLERLQKNVNNKNTKVRRRGILFDNKEKKTRGLENAILSHRNKSDMRLYLSSALRQFFPKGLILSTLNIFCSIGGGGKSIVLIDVLADILFSALNMHVLDSPVLAGKTPLLLYVSRELSESQVLSRILSTRGYDNDILNKMSFAEIEALWFEHTKDSPFSLFIHCTDAKSEGYTDLADIIKEKDREGYRTIMVVDDYLDLASFEPTIEDGFAKDAPIIAKARQLRTLSKNATIPFFALTAAQISGYAINDYNKYRGADKIRAWNLSHLQSSPKLQQETETLYAVYYDKKMRLLSVMNMKDRDGNIANNLDLMVIPMEENKMKLGETYYTSLAELQSEESQLIDIISSSMKLVDDDDEE